ncbi:MAG TPA: dTDP-4-dehydrorhamnose 3,5-epimerase family protein [Gemmatimonadaceae bacterium]|jgi:dTDP-4-dehydrorhamnose 3,5-epimerase
MTADEPRLIVGGSATDDRGTLYFVNDFDPSTCHRSYVVTNHFAGFVRAWHGHRKEGKYVTVLRGAAIVAAVRVLDWNNPDKNAKVHRYVLSERAPSVLFVPPGYANGAMSLTNDTMIQYFSTATLADSKGDDIRIDARFWNPWQVEER